MWFWQMEVAVNAIGLRYLGYCMNKEWVFEVEIRGEFTIDVCHLSSKRATKLIWEFFYQEYVVLANGSSNECTWVEIFRILYE